MKHHFHLSPRNPRTPQIDFIWDDVTGTVTGRDATYAKVRIDLIVAEGVAELAPTLPHPLGDPLTIKDIAAIFCYGWKVPAELLPVIVDDTPSDAVN